jgi:WD40 repeat protein
MKYGWVILTASLSLGCEGGERGRHPDHAGKNGVPKRPAQGLPDKVEPPRRQLGPPVVVARCAAFSPDNKLALVGFTVASPPGATIPRDVPLKLWSTETGKELRTFEPAPGRVMFVAFLPDGKRAITGGYDGLFRTWDVATGKELSRFRGYEHRILGGTLLPGGDRLLSFGDDTGPVPGKLKLWDIEKEQLLRKYDKYRSWPEDMDVSADSTFALFASQPILGDASTVQVLDLRQGTVLRSFVPQKTPDSGKYTGYGRPVALSPTAKYALSGYWESARSTYLSVWNTSDAKEVVRLSDGLSKGVRAASFSASGDAVLCVSWNGYLASFDLAGKKLWSMQDQVFKESYFTFCFSADRRLGLSISGTDVPGRIPLQVRLALWDLTNARKLRDLESPTLHQER